MKSFVLAILLLFLVSLPASAATVQKPRGSAMKVATVPSPTPTVTPTPTTVPFNSFEAFWPLTAGKTRIDSLYFLKMWKENLRGYLIFGAPQKAEYRVVRATKRLLEAQKLIDAKQTDAATATVSSSNQLLTLVESSASADFPAEVKTSIKNRLDNLIKLTDELTGKTDGTLNEQLKLNHSLIEKVLSHVSS